MTDAVLKRAMEICASESEIWDESGQNQRKRWISEARADLARPAPQPVGVKVKPLVWQETRYVTTDDDNGPREGIRRSLRAWRAGDYLIILQDSEDGRYILRTPDGKGQYVVADLVAAKFHAEEHRAASALDPQPAMLSREEADAMVAAAYVDAGSCAEAVMKRNAEAVYRSGSVSTLRNGDVSLSSQSAAKCYAAGEILEAIQARTPTDAQAALQRQLDAAKAEGRREVGEAAAKIMEDHAKIFDANRRCHEHAATEECDPPLTERAKQDERLNALRAARSRNDCMMWAGQFRALIEKEG